MSYPSVDHFMKALRERSILDGSQIGRLEVALQNTSAPLDVVASELGLIPDDEIPMLFSEVLGLDLIDQGFEDLQLEDKQVALDLMKAKEFLAVSSGEGEVELVVADPFDKELFNAISFNLETLCRVKLASRNAIREHLTLRETQGVETSDQDIATGRELTELDLQRLSEIANDAPTVMLVNEILKDASRSGASDIHIEAGTDSVAIRKRVDGKLLFARKLGLSEHPGLLSRLKIMSGLNIAEQRLPQDGQFNHVIDGRSIDFRVSILPSTRGENAVIRLLNRNQVQLSFEALGFQPEDTEAIKHLFSYPHGIVLVTGPTNSGKSTTLYTALSCMGEQRGKRISVEDPVEMEVEGVTQLQVNEAVGFTFPAALRSVLRHDPDVIMVGEIRDSETASIAVRAALTGHLVLATLHTNDAVSAISRLRDLGIESYLVSSTLRGIISQRLVRKLCPDCRNLEGAKCSNCGGVGFSGRTVLYEYFEVEESLARMISEEAGEDKISNYLETVGMQFLSRNAGRAIKEGITDLAEARSVIGEAIELSVQF